MYKYADGESDVTCHKVIGTVKLHGSSVWNFIESFSKISLNHFGCQPMLNSKLIN